jgi:hypothetical protein
MKVFAHCLFIYLTFFSLPSHAQYSQRDLIISKNIAINDFDSLDIQGPINVYIDATQTHTSLQVLGDAKRVFAVTYKEKNHILHLSTKPIYWPKPGERLTVRVNVLPTQIKKILFNSNATLFGKGLMGSLSLHTCGVGQINLYGNKLNLKSLYSKGNKSIILHNLLSSNLKIKAHNSHQIVLQGSVLLNSIDSNGDGSLWIYWINSPYLTINASGKERILLSGVAKTLDINLSQNAQLLAQKLHANKGFIKTKNQAQANVNIRNTLSAFAKNKSIIYYLTPVNFISKNSEGRGLILAKN